MKIKDNSVVLDAINLIPEAEITVGVDTYAEAYEKIKDRLIKFEAPRNGLISKQAGILTIANSFYGIDYADISFYFTPEDYVLQSVVIQPNWQALKDINIDPDIVKLIKSACEYELEQEFEAESNMYAARTFKSKDLIISAMLSGLEHGDENYHLTIVKELERF